MTAARASHSSWREKGSSRAVVQTLNTVWHSATPTAPTAESMKGKWKSRSPPQKTMRPRAVPMILKAIWMTDTRLAPRETPMEEISAVTQVPMFWPMMMGMATP